MANRYQIIAFERRSRAFSIAGLNAFDPANNEPSLVLTIALRAEWALIATIVDSRSIGP